RQLRPSAVSCRFQSTIRFEFLIRILPAPHGIIDSVQGRLGNATQRTEHVTKANQGIGLQIALSPMKTTHALDERQLVAVSRPRHGSVLF
ncbi:MAG TPA: hypothetical protein VHV99_01980, partial [Paraburkholderia sp.]|nr:hypothetical protein [Paraburkholderia sp.]